MSPLGYDVHCCYIVPFLIEKLRTLILPSVTKALVSPPKVFMEASVFVKKKNLSIVTQVTLKVARVKEQRSVE